jgi:RHS repeat-associated protein
MDGEEIIAARYLYNPFGKLIAQWGPMAPVNAMRFSSMPYYSSPQIYGYLGRFYDPNLQRWLNQDPIGERGGINLYRFCGNDPIDLYDPLGLLFGQGGDAEQNPAGVNGPTSTSYSTPLPGYTPPPQPYTGPWIGPGDPNAPAYTPYNFLPYQGLMDMMGNGSYLTPDQAAAIATPIDFALSMPEARVTCPKFGTTHAAEQAFERGFSPSRITQVLKDGEITPQVSRFGNPQLNFNLGGNQVIIDTTGRNAGKIINTFSDWTPLHGTKGYWSW